MESISFQAIGTIYTSFETQNGTPIQPPGGKLSEGRILLNETFAGGLADLEGFSHIILLYHFDRVEGCSLKAKPYMDKVERGVFATRAPRRPNPIGLSVVKLLEVRGNEIRFLGADMLNGTPLLDIKPYVPAFDRKWFVRLGWLRGKGRKVKKIRADERFGTGNVGCQDME